MLFETDTVTPELLLKAYQLGAFPWPEAEDEPIGWYSPDPRFVLRPQTLHVPKSLEKAMRKHPYRITLDQDFAGVINACAQTPRPNQPGTWITHAMVDAYTQLHHMGFAHSVEAYQDSRLVGGLYGISLGRVFFGESMFSKADNASKIAFVRLVKQLITWDFLLIDCQAYTDHLARFGAVPWPREDFLEALETALTYPTLGGCWSFDRQQLGQ